MSEIKTIYGNNIAPPPELKNKILDIETKLTDEGITGGSYAQNVNTDCWNKVDLTLGTLFSTKGVRRAYFSYELTSTDKSNKYVSLETLIKSLNSPYSDSNDNRIFNLWCFASSTQWDTVSQMKYINSVITNSVTLNEDRLEFMPGDSAEGREHNYLVGYIEFG